MSDAFWSNLPASLAALGTFITVVISLFNARRLSRQGANIEAIHKATNSMKDELVKVTGESEHARGKLEGAREAGTSVTLPITSVTLGAPEPAKRADFYRD